MRGAQNGPGISRTECAFSEGDRSRKTRQKSNMSYQDVSGRVRPVRRLFRRPSSLAGASSCLQNWAPARMAGRVLQCVEAVPIHASAPNFAVRDSTSVRCPCRGPCGTDSFVCPALGRTSSFSSLANAQVLCAGESTPIDLIRSGGRQPRAIIRVSGVWRQFGFVVGTYRTVEKLVPLVPALLDVALEGIRVERLE